MNPLKTFVGKLMTSDKDVKKNALMSFYDIAINNLQGYLIDLSEFKGKYILFVNVASKCGFTSQYRELQQLHETYNYNLVIIGVPWNQFSGQEPGNSSQIQEFCRVNYGVSFLITEKNDVKGPNQHPLYNWLTTKAINGKQNSSVKWNFQKYLISVWSETDSFYNLIYF